MIDRVSIRSRPAGWPVMYQTWGKLLFLHWAVPQKAIRPLVPGRLQLDSFEGKTWVSLSPFTMWGIRPVCFPALPFLSASHELNARTYVHLDGVPGIWFFSLDASNPLAVWGARMTFHLPYFRARMRLEQRGDAIEFYSRRKGPSTKVEFDAAWDLGPPLPEAQPGSLDFFLVERYSLYSQYRNRLCRARIYHVPWPLRQARLSHLASTMFESQGLPRPSEPPLLHAQAEPLRVEVWSLEDVGQTHG
jgi:uncharacterized protein YqjF (DUF2071 family)